MLMCTMLHILIRTCPVDGLSCIFYLLHEYFVKWTVYRSLDETNLLTTLLVLGLLIQARCCECVFCNEQAERGSLVLCKSGNESFNSRYFEYKNFTWQDLMQISYQQQQQIEIKKLRQGDHLILGFSIGGGIDQDPGQNPFSEDKTDKGIYVTRITPGGPAEAANLMMGDKILQVNGWDMTMVPHDKARKRLTNKKEDVVRLLVTRKTLEEAVKHSMGYPNQCH
uniref:uncharacterized protein LOC122780469 isoform X1 n=1 Tax=Solea senegalensis TaxID=28829 RepID=UPI001CD8E48C|nr:uncharacterized protein LOC122780469 isoform X1 [Solea senegalensis]